MLVDEGDRLDVASLFGVRWDGRVGVHRLPPHRSALLAAELRAKGVRVTDETAPLVQVPELAFTGPELRDYQDAALQLWQAAGHRGVVVLPTGSGKTHVAIGAIARTQLPTLCRSRAPSERWIGSGIDSVSQARGPKAMMAVPGRQTDAPMRSHQSGT